MSGKHSRASTSLLLFAGLFVMTSFSSLATAGDTRIYGYFAWRLEKVWDEPSLNGLGETVKADAPREITIPSFNLMMQSQLNSKAKVFINLDGDDGEDVSVNNIWGEYAISTKFKIRLGKTYRRFGLYNEILDAVPSYIGIEPPELFDNDHLILSRDTLAMFHGSTELGDGDFRYSFSIDNGEGGPTEKDNVPIGYDFRYDWNVGAYIVGLSGYTSNGDTTSDVGLGEGSPRSGVLPWMAADDFSVVGVYGQFQLSALQFQVAYWTAAHDAIRDPDSVVAVINNAGINDAQRSRFLLDDNGAVSAGNVDPNGDYDVETWYLRTGYSFITDRGELVPYFQWDFYSNPETIASKIWGGDAEAGLADDGEFTKMTLGIIYRPTPSLAVKFDASTHSQKFNGRTESYPEMRLDISYIFGQ